MLHKPTPANNTNKKVVGFCMGPMLRFKWSMPLSLKYMSHRDVVQVCKNVTKTVQMARLLDFLAQPLIFATKIDILMHS